MKYTQPYGVTDPNASYINGNPATGTMGSIPPAASVEHDQREIVALIAATGQTPVPTDLTQLLKAVKLADVHNYFKFGTNGGSASAWSMACPTFAVMPPPAGTTVWFKPGLPSVAGGTSFSVNGSAPAPVVYNDLVGVSVGDISNTAWLLMFFDGTHWLIIAGSSRQAGSIPLLTRATDWYVNGTTGDDTWDGSVPTHATATTGPFRTMQRAADEVVKYNQNGYNQTIHVADGVYANVKFKQTNGSGTVIVQGNDAAPQNCAIQTSAANTHAISQDRGSYVYRGLRVAAVGSGICDGITMSGGTSTLLNIQFGSCTRYHICAANNGSIGLAAGNFIIESGASCAAHLAATTNADILVDASSMPSLNVLGPTNVSAAFVVSTALSVIQLRYGASVGAANIHGQQYSSTGNSLIYSLGGGLPPGDVAGAVGTGGQYIA
jgi:hypothetical protein